MMVRTGKRPSELVNWLTELVGPHHYDRIDSAFDASERGAILERLETNRPKELGGSAVVQIDSQDGYRYKLADGSWCQHSLTISAIH